MALEMTKDDLLTAISIVYSLADEGVLEPDSPDMEAEAARQKEAVDMFHDFAVNHNDMLEDFYIMRGGAAALQNEAGEIPDLDLDNIRSLAEDPKKDMMAVTLELAAQQFRSDDFDDESEITVQDQVMLVSHALDLVGAFWERYGQEIQSNITNITLPDDVFDEPTAAP